MPDIRAGSASWFPGGGGRVACWWVVVVVMGVPFGGVQIGFRRARNEPPGAQDQKATWPPHEVADGGYRNRSGERIGAENARRPLQARTRSGGAIRQPSRWVPARECGNFAYRDCISERLCPASRELSTMPAPRPRGPARPAKMRTAQPGGDDTEPGGGIGPRPSTFPSTAPNGSPPRSGWASAGGFRDPGRRRAGMAGTAVALAP